MVSAPTKSAREVAKVRGANAIGRRSGLSPRDTAAPSMPPEQGSSKKPQLALATPTCWD